MPLTNNPNKTKTIEKNWDREISTRWTQFWLAVQKIQFNSVIINLDDSEQAEVDRFLEIFALLVTQILLGGNDGEWQNKYQTQAYQRAAERAIADARSQFTEQEQENILLFIAAFTGLLLLPSNRNELAFLHNRANGKLRGWIQLLIQDVNSIVHDNFGRISVDELMGLIKKRLDVTASRARMIAITEITQASQRAVVIAAIELEQSTGEEILVRWITVRDSRVRHLHAGWHGKKFTPEQIQINANISPWNCRCSHRTVRKDDVSPKVESKFSAERRFLLSRERK